MTTSQKGPTHQRISSDVVMTSQCGPRRPNLNETKMRRRYDVACWVGSKSFSGETSLPVQNSYLLIFLYYKAEILAA